MDQHLLKITLPHSQAIFPAEFRELLAKIPNLPNALFHRDEAGETINHIPGIRVVGGAGWVGIVADEENEPLLRMATAPAIMAVSNKLGVACPVVIERRKFALMPIQTVKRYYVREMVIKKGLRGTPTKEHVDEIVARRIVESIERTCARYGWDCPTAEAMGIVVDQTDHKALRLVTTTGITNQYVALLNTTVYMHLDLDGIWFAGNLTARGYGRIIADHPGLKQQRVRAGKGVVQ